MSEIEKLYENAGVEKEWKPLPYGDIEEYYPEFTAEKQLELIKWLAYKDYDKDALLININASNYTYFSLGINSCDDGNGLYEDYCFGSKQFNEALAGVVNLIWQDLTDTEKAEIKRILE